LAETRAGREQSLAMLLSGNQMSYDLQRQLAQQDPRSLAQLGALQALPQLQAALGMPAFNMPTSLPSMPNVDFAQSFRNAMGQVGGQQGGQQSFLQNIAQGASGYATGGADTGLRVTPQGMPAAAAGMGGAPSMPGGSGITPGEPGTELTPYTGGFDVEASPMYQWQLQETSDALRNQLAAQGLGQSTYGHREESRLRESLSAHERERQIANMFQMVNLGMGYNAAPQQQMAGMPQAMGRDISGVLNQSAQQTAGIYSGMGTGLAQSHMNAGAIGAQGMYGQAQLGYNRQPQVDPIMQGLGMYGQYKQLQGVFGGGAATTNPAAYIPSYGRQVATMPGMGIPMF
jgi:hypothetical protein